MVGRLFALTLGLGHLLAAAPSLAALPRLDAAACVEQALQHNASLDGAAARIAEYEAKMEQLRATFWPKLSGLALLAPMYTVRGNGYERAVERRYQDIGDWGPYTNVEVMVVQPLSSFGRAKAGIEAARERAEVERARLRVVQGEVGLEVRRLYYTHLFAQSMLPTLRQAIGTLEKAQARGQELFERGTGEITQVDLAKLGYGMSEAARFLALAEDGAELSLTALKHVMGQAHEVPLCLADSTMPSAGREEYYDAESRQGVEGMPLDTLLQSAALRRPEWQALDHGERAARAWERAELLANMPTLFLAAQARHGWAPTRDADTNPWHFDNYNTATGGLAVGLKFDLDISLTLTKAAAARATLAQVMALRREAQTGMAVEVRRAHADLHRARRDIRVSEAGLLATRRWMTSAATAYQSSTGDARDLLEGLAAYVQAKRALLESQKTYHIAAAELRRAAGTLF